MNQGSSFEQAEKWLHLEQGQLRDGAARSIDDIADGNRDAQRLSLLVDEFNHRIRNVLAMVEALVRQTQSGNVEGYRAKLVSRISGLSSIHELIGRSRGHTIRFADLLEQTLRPYGAAHEDRVHASGPDVDLEPKLALALQLVFHELATNANKHGALSSPVGWVKIRWDLLRTDDAGRKLAILWTEHGGPEVKVPQHKGFGSSLITRALETQGCVELSFKRTGVACRILIGVDHVPPLASEYKRDHVVA